MSTGDQILRAHATISSLRTNAPDSYEVEETWVKDFNGALAKIEAVLKIDLEEFKVPRDSPVCKVVTIGRLASGIHDR